MNKFLPLALFFAGVGLIVFGVSTSDSIGFNFSQFFTGAVPEKTMWLLAGGVVATVAGLISLHYVSKA